MHRGFVLTPFDYIKRAWSELTGNRPAPGKKMAPGGFNPGKALVVAGGIGLIFLLIISLAVSSGNAPEATETAAVEGSVSCPFKIPEAEYAGPADSTEVTADKTECVKLELVESPSTRRLGLSNRPSLPREEGMLFDFKKPGQYCMWMKDMNFGLDMIWLNPEKEIVAIRKGVSPKTYPASFCGPGTERYVIEVNVGIVEQAGLEKGQKIDF